MPPRDDEVQALVEQLSAELDRSVLVDDASLRLLAYSPTLGSEDEVRKTAILTRETPRAVRDLHFAQGIATATHAVRTAPRAEVGLESRVCVPIRCQGALFGYLWLIDADESLTTSRLRRRRALRGRDRDRDVPTGRTREAAAGARGAVARGAARRRTPAQREVAAHELAVGEVLRRRPGGRRADRSPLRRGRNRARPGGARAARPGARPVPPHAAAPARAQHRPGRPRRARRGRSPSAAASPIWRAARRTRSTPRSPAKGTR